MDWGRAKNVLIYAFLLLNLVLSYQLWTDVREQANTNLDFTSLGANTQKVMKEKNIQILSLIPSYTPVLPKITYHYLSGEGISTPVVLDQPIDSKLVFIGNDLVKALANQIPQINQYQFDSTSREDGIFVFLPLVEEKWPLFNDQTRLSLIYSNQKINSYQLSLIDIVPSNEEEQQKVLPAADALGTLIDNNYIPPNSVVKDIKLGYYGETFNSENQVAAPAWRFTLENGVYYVQGISGDVISPKTEKVKE
ncbi:regulatory protein YycI of two-component signal transduction system YycFG [Paenibacillus sp. DS2015]|uniref:two-component system regulatory protein YycI n=1 Tax=Paenibacillus sp. DS2015 TaxID=3373917 RepID=UPI003D1B7239